MHSPRLSPLPIDEVLDEVRDRARAGSVLLQAPTGAGKTTRVPPALDVDGAVWVVQPRRVAARAAARRIAAERGWRVGDEVGWHVRFDRRFGPDTRVLCMTSGMLLQALRRDPFLEGVGAVVFDEVHERALDLDLGLALVDALRTDARDDLRIVAMSATLDTGPLAAWLGAPVVESRGRAYPVDVRYLDLPDSRPIADRVAASVRAALAEHDGDVLVFLPGVGEIRWTAERLADCGAEVLQLYGDLPADKQDRVLAPADHRRVVLATNVAESSVTVPGVRVVIDAGLVRRMRFDPATGLDALVTERVSVASADQRAGRAGRTAPGVCLRLWTLREHQALDAFDPPEVARVSVAGAVLQLLDAGIDPRAFRWLDRPSDDALDAAITLLERLDATRDGWLTATGRRMARLPLHPRLARFLVEAARRGHGARAAAAVAMLSERDPLRGQRARATTDSDLRDRAHALAALGPQGALVQRVADQLARTVARDPVEAPSDEGEALGRAALAAWPDRVARRRADGARARMVGGKGLELGPTTGVHSALFVAVDIEPRPVDSLVRMASAVDPAWLPTTEAVRTWFDAGSQRVRAARETRYGDLVLASQTAAVQPLEAAEALAEAARAELDRVVPDDRGFRELLGRMAAAHHHLDGWPAPDAAFLAGLLPDLCVGLRTFAELRAADWTAAVKGALGWSRAAELDRLAPERIEVPSGSQIRVDWSDPAHPVLAVRMQELFGLARTPTVLGRVPVRLHLLAPNMRPQQITEDLAGFWERTWPEVRKELRARYPKHAWPEDPLSAQPERRPTRKR